MMVDHERLADAYLADLTEPDEGTADNHASSAQSNNKNTVQIQPFAKANERVSKNLQNTGGCATATTRNRRLGRGKSGNRRLRRFKFFMVIQLFFNYYGTWRCHTAGLGAPSLWNVQSIGLWCPPPNTTLKDFQIQIYRRLHR